MPRSPSHNAFPWPASRPAVTEKDNRFYVFNSDKPITLKEASPELESDKESNAILSDTDLSMSSESQDSSPCASTNKSMLSEINLNSQFGNPSTPQHQMTASEIDINMSLEVSSESISPVTDLSTSPKDSSPVTPQNKTSKAMLSDWPPDSLNMSSEFESPKTPMNKNMFTSINQYTPSNIGSSTTPEGRSSDTNSDETDESLKMTKSDIIDWKNYGAPPVLTRELRRLGFRRVPTAEEARHELRTIYSTPILTSAEVFSRWCDSVFPPYKKHRAASTPSPELSSSTAQKRAATTDLANPSKKRSKGKAKVTFDDNIKDSSQDGSQDGATGGSQDDTKDSTSSPQSKNSKSRKRTATTDLASPPKKRAKGKAKITGHDGTQDSTEEGDESQSHEFRSLAEAYQYAITQESIPDCYSKAQYTNSYHRAYDHIANPYKADWKSFISDTIDEKQAREIACKNGRDAIKKIGGNGTVMLLGIQADKEKATKANLTVVEWINLPVGTRKKSYTVPEPYSADQWQASYKRARFAMWNPMARNLDGLDTEGKTMEELKKEASERATKAMEDMGKDAIRTKALRDDLDKADAAGLSLGEWLGKWSEDLEKQRNKLAAKRSTKVEGEEEDNEE